MTTGAAGVVSKSTGSIPVMSEISRRDGGSSLGMRMQGESKSKPGDGGLEAEGSSSSTVGDGRNRVGRVGMGIGIGMGDGEYTGVAIDEPLPIIGGKPAERAIDEPFPKIGGKSKEGVTGSEGEHGPEGEQMTPCCSGAPSMIRGGAGDREKVKDTGKGPDPPEGAGSASTGGSDKWGHVSRGVITRSWTWREVQLIWGLLSWSQGSPKTIGVEGWRLVTKNLTDFGPKGSTRTRAVNS
jgi:hypothetical protein